MIKTIQPRLGLVEIKGRSTQPTSRRTGEIVFWTSEPVRTPSMSERVFRPAPVFTVTKRVLAPHEVHGVSRKLYERNIVVILLAVIGLCVISTIARVVEREQLRQDLKLIQSAVSAFARQ